ncbi:MAG: hypothetical protein PUK20_03870, partial [Firmicutes bacterium]|nr:hypothetical protein [Bacillota bacterium]MDY4106089.1 hypothetical protein [Oscillospiraceae bacterium]
MSLIQVSNLTFGYEGSFDNVFENASFSMDTNWRCGFIGRNDALEEKSALLKNIESTDTKLQIATLRHPKDLLVEANDLSVDYGDGPIFPPLHFEIRRGDRAALQGKN